MSLIREQVIHQNKFLQGLKFNFKNLKKITIRNFNKLSRISNYC